MTDNINNPPHYTVGIETRDYIRSWNMGWDAGNVIKYVSRAPYKGDEVNDLKKARCYLDWMIAEATPSEA